MGKSVFVKNKEPGLVADIGATNARLAVVRPDGTMTLPRTFALNDYATISEAIEAYLRAENCRTGRWWRPLALLRR